MVYGRQILPESKYDLYDRTLGAVRIIVETVKENGGDELIEADWKVLDKAFRNICQSLALQYDEFNTLMDHIRAVQEIDDRHQSPEHIEKQRRLLQEHRSGNKTEQSFEDRIKELATQHQEQEVFDNCQESWRLMNKEIQQKARPLSDGDCND